MKITFGEELESFARSIDLLRLDEFESVLTAVRRYLEENFAITKIETLVERVFQGMTYLAQTLDRDDEYEPYRIRDDNGEPHGLNAYAFIVKRPIWVVPEDPDTTLENSVVHLELWMPEDDTTLPDYMRLPGRENEPRGPRTTKTLIAIPMVTRNVTTSLVYFESDDLIRASDPAKEELERIARSVTRLQRLYEQNQDTHKATGQEIDVLGESSRRVEDWGVSLPSLFFAYPERSDPDVVKELQSQLEALEERELTRLFDWHEFYEGGRITEKIEEEIGSAKYFVGYLSERQDDDSARPFYDNPNVMYEAGMFQGLAHDVTQRAWNWLLVREPDSLAPFDLTTVNMLLVPRNDDGSLMVDDFKMELGKRLANLVPGADQEASADQSDDPSP